MQIKRQNEKKRRRGKKKQEPAHAATRTTRCGAQRDSTASQQFSSCPVLVCARLGQPLHETHATLQPPSPQTVTLAPVPVVPVPVCLCLCMSLAIARTVQYIHYSARYIHCSTPKEHRIPVHHTSEEDMYLQRLVVGHL